MTLKAKMLPNNLKPSPSIYERYQKQSKKVCHHAEPSPNRATEWIKVRPTGRFPPKAKEMTPASIFVSEVTSPRNSGRGLTCWAIWKDKDALEAYLLGNFKTCSTWDHDHTSCAPYYVLRSAFLQKGVAHPGRDSPWAWLALGVALLGSLVTARLLCLCAPAPRRHSSSLVGWRTCVVLCC